MAVMVPAVLALALLAGPAAVDAHGWLQDPPARQFCNPPDYSVAFSAGNGAHGQNFENVDVKNTAGGVPGLCGDPFQGKPGSSASNYAGKPCEPTEVYQEGGIMTTQVDVIANHGGFWEISICDSTDISQECFDRNVLKTTETGSERWYIMSTDGQHHGTHNPEVYKMDWQLPPGLTCDHCVVQWSWWTAHRCTFPCEEEVCGFYAKGVNYIALPGKDHPRPMCDTRSPAKYQDPQMFRNCADIKITGDGTGKVTKMSNAEISMLESKSDDEEFVPMAAEENATDSGATDSGATDSGATDSGATDSGATDSGNGNTNTSVNESTKTLTSGTLSQLQARPTKAQSINGGGAMVEEKEVDLKMRRRARKGNRATRKRVQRAVKKNRERKRRGLLHRRN